MQDNLQNNKPQNPTEIKKVDKKSNRGRKKGVSVGERQEILIIINDTYRINLSDGKNKTLQKLVTKANELTEEDIIDSEDEEGSDWKFRGHWSTFKAAFDKLFDLMVEDKIKDKGGIVTVKEFIDIYKETVVWLKEVFTNDFKDDVVVSKPKYVKKVEDKKEK